MSNGELEGEHNVVAHRLETLRFLFQNRLNQWNERRNHEWKALFGYITLLTGAGAVVLTNPERYAMSILIWGLIPSALGALGAVIWYLCELQEINRGNHDDIQDLRSDLVRIAGLDRAHDRRRDYRRWSLGPQIVFSIAVTVTLLVLVWARVGTDPLSPPQERITTDRQDSQSQGPDN